MIPVNPGLSQVLGERCYPSLNAIPGDVDIDIVDVFRRPDAVPPIADEAVARGARALWLQIGVGNPAAEERAASAGLMVISDRCIKIEHAARF